MKILFLGDYSNIHACLAEELRHLGHRVTVISDGGGYQRTEADRLLARRGGLFGSIRYLYDIFSLLPEMAGYDVVQLINPHFLKLKPGKLNYLFRKIREQNGGVWLTLAGNDHFFVKAARDGKTFRFSEYRVGDRKTPLVEQEPTEEYGWLSNEVRAFNEIVYSSVCGAMAVLPEYHMAAKPVLGDRCVFTNIPIDLRTHPFSELPSFDEGVRLAIGMKSEMISRKGTGVLLETARELEREMEGRLKVERVSGLAYKDYLRKIRDSHIVLDQLYAYSPATNALDTMALGRVSGSGAQPEYYDFIGEEKLRPIIPLSPLDADLKGTLRRFVENPEDLRRMAKEGRELVEKYNDVRVVAPKFLDQWEK